MEIKVTTMSLKDSIKKFLDDYRDSDGDYFPEDLWSLEDELLAFIEQERKEAQDEAIVLILNKLLEKNKLGILIDEDYLKIELEAFQSTQEDKGRGECKHEYEKQSHECIKCGKHDGFSRPCGHSYCKCND